MTGFSRIIRRDCRGSAAIEMTLVLPVLVMLIFGILELGRLMFAETVLHYAVAETARCRAIDTNNCGTDAEAKTYAVNLAYFMGMTSSDFSVGTCTNGEKVSTTYTFGSYLFTLLPTEFTVNVNPVSCYPIPPS